MLKARGGPLRSCSPNLYSKQSQDIADTVAQMMSRGKGSHGLLATMLLVQSRMGTALLLPRHIADSSSVCCLLPSQSPSCTVECDYSTLAV